VLKEPEFNSAKKYERKKSGHEKKELFRPGLMGGNLDGEEKLNSADIV
jgi:hypothetical protein